MCTAVWNHPNGYPVKCGQCVECRLAYSREWAIRIAHEAQMRGPSCMLNLTYDDDHLPKFGQLVKSDLQKFFKRLRKLVLNLSMSQVENMVKKPDALTFISLCLEWTLTILAVCGVVLVLVISLTFLTSFLPTGTKDSTSSEPSISSPLPTSQGTS